MQTAVNLAQHSLLHNTLSFGIVGLKSLGVINCESCFAHRSGTIYLPENV